MFGVEVIVLRPSVVRSGRSVREIRVGDINLSRVVSTTEAVVNACSWVERVTTLMGSTVLGVMAKPSTPIGCNNRYLLYVLDASCTLGIGSDLEGSRLVPGSLSLNVVLRHLKCA